MSVTLFLVCRLWNLFSFSVAICQFWIIGNKIYTNLRKKAINNVIKDKSVKYSIYKFSKPYNTDVSNFKITMIKFRYKNYQFTMV